MTAQSKALRMADWLENQYDPTFNYEATAAELRRLHEVNQELLEALRFVLNYESMGAVTEAVARAAISKATGETK